MPDNEQLRQRLEQLQMRLQNLYSKRQMMQTDHDRETRAEERFRLQSLLDENSVEIGNVATEIQDIQTQLNQGKIQQLRTELATLRRNKAYPQALDVARQIIALSPNDPQASRDVSELQHQAEAGKQAQQVFAHLTQHLNALRPIMTDLAYVLNPRNEHEQMETIATIAQNFLNGDMQAHDFIQVFQSLFSLQASNLRNNNTHQYARVADSIRNGRTVLFLGSAIPHLYNSDNDNEQTLAARLAEEIQYQNFSGSLSSIAEYYQLTPGYGRSSLLDSLQKSLPRAAPNLSLYESLAHIDAHLVIISAAYDTLLENAFRAAGKPFVEIASIIIPSDDYKLGCAVLKYSGEEREQLLPQEDLSRLDLLATHSIIYKIRGSCNTHYVNGGGAWRDSLTLAESDYFVFAENASKIIPDYLTRQFRDRSFLFIGFEPAQWEDRLLARALLMKRQNHPEPCYTIGKSANLLQQAFWEKQNVRQYEMEFSELDKYLQAEGTA
ncbi:MAG: SIR2 family protein [Candidatus Thiothrix singaporensis]|uniref:SIR2 family protein n=1 Tax=Candidatus Thiothrix singaporensis TaxID=2799669 RepID=A0A7L6AVM5_9GAMM|nr:MAG: SIR2 family protein [Candidatus Thiothrix singaporensis]